MEELCRIRDIYRLISDLEDKLQYKYGLGFNEGMLLCSIAKSKIFSSGELAQALNLSTSNTSKVILSVEKKGLIKRNMGEKDKRQMYFVLTSKGSEKVNSIKCNSEEIIKTIEVIKQM